MWPRRRFSSHVHGWRSDIVDIVNYYINLYAQAIKVNSNVRLLDSYAPATNETLQYNCPVSNLTCADICGTAATSSISLVLMAVTATVVASLSA